MATNDCHAFSLLSSQIDRQKKYAWNLEDDIPWALGIDKRKPFLPLDEDSLVFPGLNPEQRLAISQLAGLIVNATIAEMESAINRVKDSGWQHYLRQYPVNPEMEKLGELFFEEELKHARLFKRYNKTVCETLGIDPEQLEGILPKVFGTRFLDSILANTRNGGHAFWWIVASVEETSIKIYQEMAAHRTNIDPLYFEIHHRHMEEEIRHCNFAFLVLDLIGQQPWSLRKYFHMKSDLIWAQALSSTWLLLELQKIWRVQRMGTLHPFFSTISSVLPHFGQQSWLKILKTLFSKSPYISLFLNVRNHEQTLHTLKKMGTPSLPMPRPRPAKTFA